MSKPDFVTCYVCRTAIARSKTYEVATLVERRCRDLDACRDRRIILDNRRAAESTREEIDRWDEQFNPKRGIAR